MQTSYSWLVAVIHGYITGVSHSYNQLVAGYNWLSMYKFILKYLNACIM